MNTKSSWHFSVCVKTLIGKVCLRDPGYASGCAYVNFQGNDIIILEEAYIDPGL